MNGREREPNAWVQKAEHDLTAVRTLAASGTDVPWDVVVFHCQQAAEKYLKALLVGRDHAIPKIHDLERLLQLCSAFQPSLASLAGDCRRLTQLGFVSRYPDTPGEPSETDAREAMGLANRICDTKVGGRSIAIEICVPQPARAALPSSELRLYWRQHGRAVEHGLR